MMMTALRTTYFYIRHSLAILLALAVTPLHLAAQAPSSPAAPPLFRFEVASIRPHRFAGDEPSNRRILPGGRFIATATTVRTLIRIASGLDDNRMSGGPGWIDNEFFDINAMIADHAEVKTPEQFQQLILSLLEERFGFKFHREQKEGPVYWLELNKPGKLGPALKPSGPDSQPNMSNNSNGARSEMKVSKMSMVDIAAGLPPGWPSRRGPYWSNGQLRFRDRMVARGDCRFTLSITLYCSEGPARAEVATRQRHGGDSRH